MNPIAFRLFGQPIYWYGIIISLGVLLGIIFAIRNAKIFGVDQDTIVDFALLAIPLSVIGARLYYVVFEWEQYKGNLLDIINIRKGGLAIYGAVIGGILAGLIFSRWKKQDFWNLADICAPSLILGQAIGRWGNYVNQEAYGYAVKNPEWQWFPAAVFIEANKQWHLATFFYESFWNFIIFFILMSLRKYRKRRGTLFLLYLVLYSAGRFFIEGMRTDSLYLGSIRVSQLLSALLFVFGIALLIYRGKHAAAGNVATSESAADEPVQMYFIDDNKTDELAGENETDEVKPDDYNIEYNYIPDDEKEEINDDQFDQILVQDVNSLEDNNQDDE